MNILFVYSIIFYIDYIYCDIKNIINNIKQ